MKDTPPNKHRVRTAAGNWNSTDASGMNGAFEFTRPDNNQKPVKIFCIVSDGDAAIAEGWEHVSVTVDRQRCPSWEEMCFVKDAFWKKDETVVQFHPPEAEYVSFHDRCLHLWRNKNSEIKTPPSIFVGPKKK